MAAIQPDQIVQVFDDGVNGKTALFVVKNVSTGDTIDLSAQVYFSVVKRAVIVGDTSPAGGLAAITEPASIAIPSGFDNDGVWALVVGVAPITSLP